MRNPVVNINQNRALVCIYSHTEAQGHGLVSAIHHLKYFYANRK